MPLAVTRPSRRAGKYSRRIDIQQPTGVTDADTLADTDASIVWTTLLSSWASVTPNATSGGTEGHEAEQGEMIWVVVMPYQPGILDGMRVRETFYTSIGATTFDATTATDPSATWAVNALAGMTVMSGSSEAVIQSNTATAVTILSWTGATPTNGAAFTVARSVLDIMAVIDLYEQHILTELHCVSRRYPPV